MNQSTLPLEKRVIPFNPNSNSPPTSAEIKSQALQLGIPEIDLQIYARAQWLLAHFKFADSPKSRRAVLAQYCLRGYETRIRNGITLRTTDDTEIENIFKQTVRICRQHYIPDFERKYSAFC